MQKNIKKILYCVLGLAILLGFLIYAFLMQNDLVQRYRSLESIVISDRNNETIIQKPNPKGYYATYAKEIPKKFKNLLIQKEDRFFYYHLGVNPMSILRAVYRKSTGGNQASSTITQQLVKILLNHEKERTLKNKIIETWPAMALEIFQSKKEILNMYANSIYFGNQIQGIEEASRAYFGVAPELLSETQMLQLLATISSPSTHHPLSEKNIEKTQTLAKNLKMNPPKVITIEPSLKKNFKDEASFELETLGINCAKNCQLTIDRVLSKKIRAIINEKIIQLGRRNVRNSAVIVIKIPENEIISIIGSPDPQSSFPGYQINMAVRPRPIGSTIKPFIYLKGFEKGLRPYSRVEDREYKYLIEDGHALYPKNYDYKYHGEVSLHYALSNSLNVPTVKVLEFVGLENFYDFLEKDLGFMSIQPLESYQLGIALGGLEMNLLNLTYFFTIFSQEGILKNLNIAFNENFSEDAEINAILPNNIGESLMKKIADPKYIQLVNAILNDRKTGIEQFGLKSNLNLFQNNYALKTGTSREFHDSWMIGYTPDFLIGVWMGNADNTPTDELSGQLGSGSIWSEVMELLFHSQYNKKTPLNVDKITEIPLGGSNDYGFSGEEIEDHLNLLLENNLIFSPHNGDIILLESSTQIPLSAREESNWYANDNFIGFGAKTFWTPKEAGNYTLKARDKKNREESIQIVLKDKE